MKKLVVVFALLISTACASLHSVSLTPIPKQRNTPVKAIAEKWVILALTFDNDFVNALPERLAAHCPNGKVTGILTKHYIVSYLLAHKVVVKASGFCVKDRGHA